MKISLLLCAQIRAESTFEAPTFLLLIFFRNKGMLLMLRWILVFTTVNTCSWYACMNFIFMESRLPLLNRSGYCCFVRLDIVCVYIIKAYCLLYLGKTLEITQNLQDIHKGRLLFPGARQDSYTHGRWKF